MSLTTVTVSIHAWEITGGPSANAVVRFEMTSADIISSGIVMPAPIRVVCDADGIGSAELFANADGTQGTQYRVDIEDSSGRAQFSGLATIPSSDCNLHDVLNLQPPASVDDAQAAANTAQAAAAQAVAVLSDAGFVAVKNDLPNIGAVAADRTNIDAVAADLANINAVAGDRTNIDAVAADLENINLAVVSINVLGAKLSVQQFGVIPDVNANNADNYSLLQAAIDLADTDGKPRHVWVPPCLSLDAAYRVGSTLRSPSQMTFSGVKGRSALMLKDGANCHLLVNDGNQNGSGTTSTLNNYITIKDLVFDGNLANQSAFVLSDISTNRRLVWLYYVSHINVEGCLFRSGPGTMLEVNGNGQRIGPFRVLHCDFEDGAYHGFMDSHSERQSIFSVLRARNCAGHGIYGDASEATFLGIQAYLCGSLSTPSAPLAGVAARHVISHNFSAIQAMYNMGPGIGIYGSRHLTGSAWAAQQNGQQGAGLYNDIDFGADPIPDGRGFTGFASVAGVLAGNNSQLSEGYDVSRAAYSIAFADEIVDPVSLSGVTFTGSNTGDLLLPADPSPISINNVKQILGPYPSVSLDRTKGATVGMLAIVKGTGMTFLCRSATKDSAAWERITAAKHYRASRWYLPEGYILSAGSAQGTTAMKGIPWLVPERCTLSDLGVRITTGQASSHVQLAIYNADQDTYHPTTLVGNTADLDASAAALVGGAITQGNQQIEPGWYWLFGQTDGSSVIAQGPAATSTFVASFLGSLAQSDVSAGSSAGLTGISITNTYGTWPSDVSASSLNFFSSAALFLPEFKVASAP
jgi:hypothetical protein